MILHILCPFYRVNLAKTLVKYFEPEKIEYYPIVAPKEDIDFGVSWVHNIRVKELNTGEQCFRKFNDFADNQSIYDNDYYAFVCDETVFEPGFFYIIRNQTGDVIFFSSYRGDSIPSDGSTPHLPGVFYVKSKNDVRIGTIGLGQFIIKGSVFKKTRFKVDKSVCDGEFAVELLYGNNGRIAYLPNSFVFSNYLQPGRFTDESKFIKSHWKLPEII